MCEFCNTLKSDKQYKLSWLVRSTMADDNICEIVNSTECELCKECHSEFTLSGYQYQDDTYVTVDYHHEIKAPSGDTAVIYPFSEGMQWNYCPICGEQISKTIRCFDDNGVCSVKENVDE